MYVRGCVCACVCGCMGVHVVVGVALALALALAFALALALTLSLHRCLPLRRYPIGANTTQQQQDYWGSLSAMDHQVGRVRAILQVRTSPMDHTGFTSCPGIRENREVLKKHLLKPKSLPAAPGRRGRHLAVVH